MAKQRKAKQVLIFTENLGKRILAEGFEEINNLEGFLNRTHGKEEEVILRGVKNWYKNKSGVYRPKSERNYLAIKCDQIDFVFASSAVENSIYAPNHMPKTTRLSVLYGLHGLKHDLIGEIVVNKKTLPKSEKDQLLYVSKILKGKNFIPFYNPRQKRLQDEFKSLFQGTLLYDKNLPKILLNRTSNTINSKSIYLEPGNKDK